MVSILVLESDEDAMGTLRGILSSAGYKVFEAEDAGGALEMLEALPISLVLMEAGASIPGSFDTMRLLRDEEPDIPIVVMSHKLTPDEVRRVMENGAADFIVKPIDRDRLISTLKMALKGVEVERPRRARIRDPIRRVNDMEALRQIAEKIASSPNWEDSLEVVLTDLNSLPGAESSSLFLREGKGFRSFRVVTSQDQGRMEKGVEESVGGPAGWVMAQGEPLLATDISTDERISEWAWETYPGEKRAAASVPVILQNRVEGALEIISEKGKIVFSPSSISFLSSVAFQLATRMESVLLHESLDEEKKNFQTLYSEMHKLYRWNRGLGAIIDYKEMMDFVVRNGDIIVECDLSALMIKEEGWVIYLPEAYRHSKELSKEVKETFVREWQLQRFEAIDPQEIKVEGVCLDDGREVKPLCSTVCISLGMKKNVEGMWLLSHCGQDGIEEDKQHLILLAAGTLASAVENAILFEKTLHLARVDGLTEVYNYRTFTEYLDSNFERARRYRSNLSLLMLDVDHFKDFNDTFGHQRGDEVLKGLADLLKEQVRNIDIVFRYGGEEFGILLPDTSKAGAIAVAERIRSAIDHKGLSHGGGMKVTVCIGIATYPDERISNPQGLVRLADKALYKAKREGRNRVRAS